MTHVKSPGLHPSTITVVLVAEAEHDAAADMPSKASVITVFCVTVPPSGMVKVTGFVTVSPVVPSL
jgi:hypothetical protein